MLHGTMLAVNSLVESRTNRNQSRRSSPRSHSRRHSATPALHIFHSCNGMR